MRAGINTWFLNQPVTGSGQYVRQLLDSFAKLAPEDKFLLCGPQPASPATNQIGVPLQARGDIGKVWFEQIGVPMAAAQASADLIHYPYFAAPLLSRPPLVVTVHDLIPLMKEYQGSMKAQAYTKIAVAGARRAAMIITDLIASQQDIIEKLHIPERRVRVVYLGVEPRYTPERDSTAVVALRQKYGLRRDFILYLGGLDPRKNMGTLLRSYAMAREQLSDPPELVIAGPRPESTPYPSMVRSLKIETSVKFIGAVDEAEKPALYGIARVFVFPSLYEGFGLPPLEAMACGTPVVCSNASSLPEVVGDAALNVDPRDQTGLAEALCQVIEDHGLAARLRNLGIARASTFTWERTGEQTLAIYREVLGQ